jgi:hypothetical protein
VRNNDEKIKDMVESVLPSSARRATRANRAALHGRERARARALLHDLTTNADPDDCNGDLRHEDRAGISPLVWSRRGADKVGPTMRWATRRVQQDRTLRDAAGSDRMAHFARLLPDNTIGHHALSHLEWAIGEPAVVRELRRLGPSAGRGREDGFRGMVVGILEAGLHGALNRRLKQDGWTIASPRRTTREGAAEPGAGLPPRLLAGAHDVDAFVAAARTGVERHITEAFASEQGLDVASAMRQAPVRRP